MSSSINLDGFPGFKFDPVTGTYIVGALDVKAFCGIEENENPDTGWSSARKSKAPFGSGSKRNYGWSSSKKPKANSDTKTMMSSPYKVLKLPGIEIDQATGKCTFLPCNFKAIFGNHDNEEPKSGRKGSKKLKDTYSPKPTKFRKVELGARKQLFKVPAGNRMQATESPKEVKRKMSFTSVGKSCIPSKSNLSGAVKNSSGKKKMAPMETIVEQSFRPSILITPPTPLLKCVNKEATQECSRTPDSDEFVKLELFCKTPKITNDSPVSTVCDLFESKMLLGGEKEHVNSQMTLKQIAEEIRNIAKANQKVSEDISRKMKEVMDLQATHQENLQMIIALEEKLNETNICDTDEENKENNKSIRRSLRLKNKSPSQPSEPASKPAGSPVILKSGDLRKSTLTKSLVSKCQKYQIDSPRMQKALAMYNSTRTTLGTLLTPKISRNQFIGSGTRTNLRESLSIKVQQQCLMLQDTPNVKKIQNE